ncbi:formimidoylglutamate deiminase [Acidicapsa dinghuensis]|uniref:Formimidoylglutamate deiminase n=1 Tax=Acidicapsa dinghuensis TaxID=2218256 RepID=A0ABW1EKR1_9BACT|nr:formimidoylglutamate deiminase [Acidicapsa dinghuensis]
MGKSSESVSPPILFLPDMLHTDGVTREGVGLLMRDGVVESVIAPNAAPVGVHVVRLAGKALLPGLANAHSHTFQRLFRGRAEGRAVGGDTFWTWRVQMYRAANFVSPEDLYDVARATFLEMVRAGITVVGEFHYLHGDPDGRPYDDPNLLSRQVIAAAQSVGLRICLLRTAYFRAGFQKPTDTGQRRFYEQPDKYLHNLEALATEYAGAPAVSVGTAPHSIRAVPADAMQRIVEQVRGRMPVHLHISEQPAENEACVAEYGATPVSLLADRGVIAHDSTLVHAIHLTDAEFAGVAWLGATICSCPTTERNLGDGIFPVDKAARLGIPVAFGSDSQAQIDVLEDARQMEYHLRLRDRKRGVIDGSMAAGAGWQGDMAGALLQAATVNGYRALGLHGGRLAPGEPADFLTANLNDLSVLGTDAGSLAEQTVFAMAKSAVRDVAVAGKLILQDGHHGEEEAIEERYCAVQRRYAQAH